MGVSVGGQIMLIDVGRPCLRVSSIIPWAGGKALEPKAIWGERDLFGLDFDVIGHCWAESGQELIGT